MRRLPARLPFISLLLLPSACTDADPGANRPRVKGSGSTGGVLASPGSGGGPGTTGGAPGAPSDGSASAGGAPEASGGNAAGVGGSNVAGRGGSLGAPLGDVVPLFDSATEREPAIVEDTGDALITRFSDRARDRHAREQQFHAYEHYLPLYWENRTVQVELIDPIGRGGDTITFHVTSEWKFDDGTADLRCFYRGIGTVAEYHDNLSMTPSDDLHYTRLVTHNQKEGRPLRAGDRMEFELSQFLDAPPRGRDNYYGTVFLYIVGQGLVPWEGTGERRDSYPIAEKAWLGGHTTLHRNESDEPDTLFMQMATNLAPQNGQRFVIGRRVAHTSFVDGSHDESDQNPVWSELSGLAGPLRIHESCNGCHEKNGRAVPPEVGAALDRFVLRVGTLTGEPEPLLGSVLQPEGEGAVRLAAWVEEDGLRRPMYAFDGAVPEAYSARVSPALVGLGLLEAVPESAILALADPDDRDDDGVSGRPHVVTDYLGTARLGRFGWKAGQPSVRQQVAGALRTDMGVLTSVYPTPDCGSAQAGCGPTGAELGDGELDDLVVYVSLLGLHAQRNVDDPETVRGQELFESTGCASCHVPTFETSEFAVLAEVRSQTIHPYTDLLLHDMGEGLADDLSEGEAAGAEWRTPPLWNIGLTEGISGGEAYLHDGRARSLEEAVLWHGGEGTRAREAFVVLAPAEQAALIAFLRSL